MKNTKYPRQSKQVHSENFPNFLEVEANVFTKVGDDIYIGKTKIEEAFRSTLRDEAKAMQVGRLWEILNASVINEAYNLSLIQSKDWDHIQFAKAMKHWSSFMMNVIHQLAKK